MHRNEIKGNWQLKRKNNRFYMHGNLLKLLNEEEIKIREMPCTEMKEKERAIKGKKRETRYTWK
jgi:hypothetical protein